MEKGMTLAAPAVTGAGSETQATFQGHFKFAAV